MTKLKPNKIAVFLVAVLGLAFAAHKGISYVEESMTPVPVYGLNDHRVPDWAFTNQLGQEVSSDDLAGKLLVVDFFFTSCPTICPKMTRNLQSLHDVIRQDESINILSFTVDPKRDQPARLKAFAEAYRADHKTWQFLTGEKEDLYRLGNKGFLVSATTTGVDDLDFIHSENIVLVDESRKIRGFYNGTDPKCVNQILRDIKKLKKSNA